MVFFKPRKCKKFCTITNAAPEIYKGIEGAGPGTELIDKLAYFLQIMT